MENVKDPELWELAQKRASFKQHLATYIIMNIFFWVVWYFTGQKHSGTGGFPWPVWPMIGWGIGLLFHYMGAYVFLKNNSAEREYQKLKDK
ncbi:MAG TPA: 2TM domain-containing protein [Chitinophagaceae bacterium]|nr:2TM domain-containing protein [Chitinophagaceae bacterium]